MSVPPSAPQPASGDSGAAPPVPPRPAAPTALLVLLALALGFALWAAQTVLLPVLLAIFFALVGNPIIRGLRRMYVPTFLAALLVLASGLLGAAALAYQLIEPASEWAREAPAAVTELAPRLRELAQPVDDASDAAENIARAASGDDGDPAVQVVQAQADDPYAALATAPRIMVSVLAVVLLTLFFMVYGESLQRHALSLLANRRQKRVTVEILQSIEREISRYVLTISVINALVGLAFAAALYLLDIPLPEALLWGTMAALLNFAPYIGAFIGITVVLLMGFLTFDEVWRALLPGAIYVVLHTVEGQVITPVILGRQMRLSPLILVVALLVFGWLWGIVGLLLAVPLLVCVKIVLSRIEGMEGWAALLE